MEEKINEYIKKFYEVGVDVGKSWDLVHKLGDLFGLDTVEAYSYVSKYLSKKWEVD